MQGITRAVRSCQETLKLSILRHSHGTDTTEGKKVFSRFGCVTSSPTMQQKGLENTTVAEVLMTKGEEKTGSWLWCHTNDTVYDAVKHMAQNNVGSLVVLKPGEQELIAGIITERGNWSIQVLEDPKQHNMPSVTLKSGMQYAKCKDHLSQSIYGKSFNTTRQLNSQKKGIVLIVDGDKADYLKKIITQGRSSKHTRVAEIMTDENKLITVTSDTNILQAMKLMTENQIRHVPVINGKIVGMISVVDVVRAVVEQQSEEVKRLNEFIKGDYY